MKNKDGSGWLGYKRWRFLYQGEFYVQGTARPAPTPVMHGIECDLGNRYRLAITVAEFPAKGLLLVKADKFWSSPNSPHQSQDFSFAKFEVGRANEWPNGSYRAQKSYCTTGVGNFCGSSDEDQLIIEVRDGEVVGQDHCSFN